MYLLLYYYCKYTFYSFDLENDLKWDLMNKFELIHKYDNKFMGMNFLVLK